MKNAENDSPFRIFTYRSKKRTVRFLVSPSVMERIPFLEEVLMRAASAARKDFVWPPSVVITGEYESVRVPGDSVHMVFPCWLFARVAEARNRKMRLFDWVLGEPEIKSTSWDIAHTMSHYIAHLQIDAQLKKHCASLLEMSISMPLEYRPFRTIARTIMLIPIATITFPLVFIGPMIFQRSKRLLYVKGKLQRSIGLRRGLNKTRRRLSELGEPAEKLKDLVLPPDLKLVEDSERDMPQE